MIDNVNHPQHDKNCFCNDCYVNWKLFSEEPVDNVNHPSHYTQGEIECIDAIEASMTHQAFLGYCKGNAMKYLWRYENKGGGESLEKARWYINRMIRTLQMMEEFGE